MTSSTAHSLIMLIGCLIVKETQLWVVSHVLYVFGMKRLRLFLCMRAEAVEKSPQVRILGPPLHKAFLQQPLSRRVLDKCGIYACGRLYLVVEAQPISERILFLLYRGLRKVCHIRANTDREIRSRLESRNSIDLRRRLSITYDSTRTLGEILRFRNC